MKTLNIVLCARTKIFFHTQSSKLVLWCFTCVHKTKKSFIDFEITTIIYLYAYIVYTCNYKSKKNSENKIILFECKFSLYNSFVQNRYNVVLSQSSEGYLGDYLLIHQNDEIRVDLYRISCFDLCEMSTFMRR